MADEYDIVKVFAAIEKELMSSMIRNLKRHKDEEDEMGMEWSMWQTMQLEALEKYKKENQRRFKKQFQDLNKEIEELIRIANEEGGMDQEIEILEAIKNGFSGTKKASPGMTAEFFRLNERKLDALIEATVNDMQKAETAILRMANDQYRKVIYNAQVYANTGAGTYEKAVDMATRDFLRVGLNCVTYANGARHTLSDYADMALRTASKRAYLQGEGTKRQEWGVHTVIMNKRGNPCPKCLPFCGKVLIDDVWSGGSKNDGPYPLMSKAVEVGLYHPRCKDSHTTYFSGVSTANDKWTKEELDAIGEEYKREEWLNYAKRQAEKYIRIAEFSLDNDNKKKYRSIADSWNRRVNEQTSENIQRRYQLFQKRIQSEKATSLHKNKLDIYAEFTELIEDRNIGMPFAYSREDDVIKFNPSAPHIEDYDMDYVFVHELTHRMNELEYHSWKNEKLLEAIETCSKKVYDKKEEILQWFDIDGRYETSFAISDIISALTEGAIQGMVGHEKEYWSDSDCKALEVFANISAIEVLDLPEKTEFTDILNELYQAYKEMTE